jgi:DNA-directed RNA polymerase specialized sigma24 family protein
MPGDVLSHMALLLDNRDTVEMFDHKQVMKKDRTKLESSKRQIGIAAAKANDGSAFALLVDRYRRALHLHCYRMLGSFEEAEDLVQETFLRAWRNRESFECGSSSRAWLYRIATNACLDSLRRSSRRVPPLHSFAEVT